MYASDAGHKGPRLTVYFPLRMGCRRAHGMMPAGGCCFTSRWRIRSMYGCVWRKKSL